MDNVSIFTAISAAEIEPRLGEWADLVRSIPLPVSFSPDWLFSWLAAYGDDSIEVDVSFVYHRRRLVAVLPLMVRKEGEHKTLKLLSDSCSDFLGFPFVPGAADLLTASLEEALRRIAYTRFDFGCLHQGSDSLLVLVDALSNCGVVPVIRIADRSLSATLDDEYRTQFESALRRRRWRRKLVGMDELGSVHFEVLTDITDDVLVEIRALHVAKWAANKILPQFSDDRRIDFIRTLASRFRGTGQITLLTLRRGGQMIAYRLGFTQRTSYYDWNTSFEHQLGTHGPGTALLLRTIQHLIDSGYSKLEFMNGNEKYKQAWATRTSNVYRIMGEPVPRQADQFEAKDTLKLSRMSAMSCLILDIDGVVGRGGTALPKSVLGIQRLQAIGIRFGFLTNASAVSVEKVRAFLAEQGIWTTDAEVMTSTVAIEAYLREAGITKCMVIGGEPELPRVLTAAGIEISQLADVEAVVVGFAKELRYEQICAACDAIAKGAAFVCADTDQLYAAAGGNMPGSAWISAAITAACGRAPVVVGKPGEFALLLLLKCMGVAANDCMLVGDNLQSDIVAGRNAGLLTCLHLGGVTTLEEVVAARTSQRPDFIVESFDDITEAYGAYPQK